MRHFLFRSALGLIAASMAAATPALAQDDDWDFAENAQHQVSLASVEFGGGVALLVRCEKEDFTVLVAGLPAHPDNALKVEARRADGRASTYTLFALPDRAERRIGSAERMARMLRGGGGLTLTTTEGAAQPMRLALDLPTQTGNLDRVIQACGRSFAGAYDDRPRIDEALLLQRPQPRSWPSATETERDGELTCVADAEAVLRSCVVEFASPRRWGDQVAQAFEGVKLDVADPAAVAGRAYDVDLSMGIVTVVDYIGTVTSR